MVAESATFRFKQFELTDRRCGMKLGTDAVVLGVLAGMDRFSRDERIKVADIGAGCGIISLMIAQRMPEAAIDAVEIDAGAFSDLVQNVECSPWSARINVFEGDFHNLTCEYNLIVSNPPFYKNGEISPTAPRAVARHVGALSAHTLIDFASDRLTSDGILSMIVPVEDTDDAICRAAFKRLSLWRRIDVATSARRGVTRCVLEFTRDSSAMPVIYKMRTNSEAYKKLTSDFYLDN